MRPVDHLKGPAWVTCLKVVVRGTPQHYAVFIQDDKVIDWRGGIVIDQCHKETYTPLETATRGEKTRHVRGASKSHGCGFGAASQRLIDRGQDRGGREFVEAAAVAVEMAFATELFARQAR